MHASAAGYVACKAARIQATMIAWVGRNEGSIMARGVRKSITIPGLLAPTVKLRCAEFGHTIFTPYAVEVGLLRSSLGRQPHYHARDRTRYASRTRCGRPRTRCILSTWSAAQRFARPACGAS